MHSTLSFFSYPLLAALATGCTTPAPSLSVPDEIAAPAPEYVPVTRYGRYTLVELAPATAQRDLLLQVVDVSVLNTLHASVGDGLRHVLQRSGYQLCGGPQTEALHTLPLPAAHYRLGPLTLRDALQTLAGPAWALRVDHTSRHVCFEQTLTVPTEPAPLVPPSADAGPQSAALPSSGEEQR